MFIVNADGTETHSECTHDYLALAEAKIAEGEDWGDVAEYYTNQFASSIQASTQWDTEEDVGAVVDYYKAGVLVAYFDYENFVGTILN